MLLAMLSMGLLGLSLLLAGTVLARRKRVRGADPFAVARILQALGVALLVGALLTRPYDPRTAAFPPPPDVGGAQVGR